jgi:hypothetical protein
MTIAECVKDAVLRLARVPAHPHVPEGAEESVRVFNAGRRCGGTLSPTAACAFAAALCGFRRSR